MFSRRPYARMNRGRVRRAAATGLSILSGTIASDGESIALVYSAALNESSVPDAGDFALTGTSANPTGTVDVTGDTVTILLDAAIEGGADPETVTLDYTPGANPIEDTEGIAAAALSGYALTNGSTVDTTAPVLQGIDISEDGLDVTLTYHEPLDETSTPAAGDFSLTGTASAPDSVVVSGSTVVVTVDAAIEYDETVTLDYTAGVNPIQDAAGNDAANLTGQATTNGSEIGELPALVSAVVPANGLSVVLTYDEDLDETSIPADSDYSLSGTSSAPSGTVTVSGAVVTVPVDTAIGVGETVTLSYTAGVNPVLDLFGNAAANLTDAAVTNNSTEDITAPVFSSGAIPSDGLSVVLTYGEALDTGSVPAAGDYSLSGTSSVPSGTVLISGTTVTIPVDTAIFQGETVTISYTAGANPIQDAAGNDSANLTDESVSNNSEVSPSVFETIFQTLIASDASWGSGEVATGTEIVHDGWGAGGAGATAGGGGGEHARVTEASASPPYNIAIGAGGAGAGGNTTVDSTLLIATGGGAASGSTPGTGGSGGTGDSTHAGGDGTAGGAGGGSGGSTTAASGTAAGEPDGTFGASKRGTPGAGGPASTNGSSGMYRATYLRAADLSFPYVVDFTFGRDTGNTTSRNIVIPGTHTDGDRLLCFFAVDSGACAISGWSAETANNTGGLLTIDSSGSEAVAMTSNTERAEWLCLRIRNADELTSLDLTEDSTSEINVDLPSHTHGSGSVSGLWFTVATFDGGSPEVVSSLPSGWNWFVLAPQSGGGVGLIVGLRRETAETVDPDALGLTYSAGVGNSFTGVLPVAA